ncbi:hypothetical protein [Nocardia otitidiscaviarum]|uniref:hypothetical protein n=1 Tax=Nocardia otitidiscaviarum TaxID=1823 RepID=UPI00189473EF|nr:hypothetical protein [Nocardia otitidiscaviarum]MBF6180730.1 hypothetical protein [Nocardia otitidiscaviarum]
MNDRDPMPGKQEIDERTIALVIQMHQWGLTPSRILREIISLYPNVSTPELMDVMRSAFSLPYPAVQCIGGWWADGTGELSDTDLDAFLVEEISRHYRSGTP